MTWITFPDVLNDFNFFTIGDCQFCQLKVLTVLDFKKNIPKFSVITD